MSTIDDTENSPLLNTRSLATQDGDAGQTMFAISNVKLATKIAAAMLSFSTLGLFNSSIGAVLPLISEHYSLTDVHVSLLFLAGPVGYILAAQSSDMIHYHLGQRGIAAIGPLFQVLATSIVATHPGFGWILAAYAVQGLGTGLLDGSWCAWAGSMEKANTISGLLHGSYSIGGAAGPFVVALITAHHQPWWLWYSILAGISLLELIFLVTAFRREDAASYRRSQQCSEIGTKTNTKAIFHYQATWFCAMYLLAYVGTETAISGWVVSFMLRDRNATTYLANLASSGFWIGMAIGRLVLGYGTDKIGVRRATMLYFFFSLIFEALFAVFTSPIISVVLMTFLGFIMGPLFPSGIVVLTRLVPRDLHIAVVSFVASLGQVGGALLPFAIGSVVQILGIGVFQYAILVQTSVALTFWYALARLPAIRGAEDNHVPIRPGSDTIRDGRQRLD